MITSPLSLNVCTYDVAYTGNMCIKFESNSISRCGEIVLNNTGLLNLTSLAKSGRVAKCGSEHLFCFFDSVTPTALICLKVCMLGEVLCFCS